MRLFLKFDCLIGVGLGGIILIKSIKKIIILNNIGVRWVIVIIIVFMVERMESYCG